ncbi:MAG: hypothetical protein RLY71_1784 [Pseudomonadota bacterium]|jgi:exodeoxyribonuclease V beta subunit
MTPDQPTSQPLDVLTLPLHGSRLIEASAGTGKTWTIAALYLRLVLGHGTPESAPPRPLQPAEVLVMTFTRAATRELSDRIRARLAEAARCFRGEALASADDTVLQALLDACPDGTDARLQAAFRLASAAEAMDDAAVFTIDAWCQRMLREHAFESGNLFEEELLPDESLLREQAVRDHWRRAVYPLQGEALGAVLAVWPSLHALADDVRELLPKLDLLATAAPDAPGDALPDLLARHVALLASVKAGWAERAESMRAWLMALLDSPKNPYSGVKLKRDTVAKVLDALQAWALDPLQDRPDFPEGSGALQPAERLTPASLADALKKNASATPPAEFAAYADLLDQLKTLPSLATALRRHAARAVAARMAELKARAGRYGFADMLVRLDQALAGPRGPALRERILAQYPIALVDEFQDTSPLQLRLFAQLYQPARNDATSGLFLIGDPKQSIYGFRGADIYSYLQARAATAGRHYALTTNYRSTAGVVAAVNHVFEQAEQGGALRGVGAFHFPVAGALQLPFEPVGAAGRAERFVTAAGTWPALTLASDLAPLPAALLRARYAAYNAEQIVALLNDTLAGFDGPQGWRRLQPADIAVLVRSRVEAEAVRRALRERGVASVFLSDQDSVLGSAEAVDLLHWLRAVAEPRDARLARVAYAGGTFGLALAELARIARDDEAWDELQERLVRLQRVWQRQGVLAMLRQTLHLLDLPARWLGDPATPGGGERRLTNVLHLAELLQSASHHLEGEQALLRWLTEQIADHAAGRAENADDRIVRLESDAGLVQVITVHKSKGLEYPLVFVPFASSTRPVDRRGRRFVERIDADGLRQLDFGLDQAAIDAADRERLREELRLIYVALTRARHGLWLGVGLARYNSRSGEERTTLGRSALGHLLGGSGVVPADGPWTAAQVDAALTQLQSGCAAHIERQTLSWPPLRPSRLRRRDEEAALLEAPTYHGHIDSDWTVGSFSALVRDLGAGGSAAWHFSEEALPETSHPPARGAALAVPAMPMVPPVGRLLGDVLREEALREEGADLLADLPAPVQAVRLPEPDAPDARAAADPQARHRFPRGALPGNFLHEQLEALAGFGFDQAGSDDFLHLLKRRCDRQGRAYRAEEVAAWLDDVTRTVLPPLGAPLAEVEHFLTEMEFWLPSAGLHAEALDDLCRTHLLPGLARPELPARRLRGLLMGFADLVFEHGGRYWVLDYKSNALGDADGAYTPAALQHAMLQHRYELQAALYQLALHRLLRQRLGAAYDPAEQLGGAIYLFLRGVAGPARGCVHLPADPALLQALDALLGP